MKRLLAVLIVLTMLMGLPLALDGGSEPMDMTEFKGGSGEKTINFPEGGGSDLKTQLDIYSNSRIYSASMMVQGLPTAGSDYPEDVRINFGDTNDPEWRFEGAGYGGLGKQYKFDDDETGKTVMMANGYNNDCSIWLPKNATVTTAEMNVKYKSISNYGVRVGHLTGSGSAPYTYSNEYGGTTTGPRLRFWEGSGYTDVTAADHDAMIRTSPYASTNYGTNSYLLYSSTGNAFYVHWDTGPAPPVNQVTKVEIGFYHRYTYGPLNAGAWWVTGGSWSESTITWNNAPEYNPEPIATKTWSTTSYVWDWMDITPLGLGWLGARPTNPKIDFGDDDNYEWTHPGEFVGDVVTPNFATNLNSYLASAPVTKTDQYGNEMVKVPINVTTAVGGALELKGMDIRYVYEAKVDVNPSDQKDLRGSLNKMIPDVDGNNITIKINCSSSSAGQLKLYDLAINYEPPNFAPRYRAFPAKVVMEDTARPHLYDLKTLFMDDRTDPGDLKYTVAKVECPALTEDQTDIADALKDAVTIVDDTWVSFDMTSSDVLRDWNGDVQVQFRAKDDGREGEANSDKATTTDPVVIPVAAVNDEPEAGKLISSGFYALNEGEEDELEIWSAAFPGAFFDVEYDQLSYDVEVDPEDEVEGEGLAAAVVEHTDSYNPRVVVEFEALGDWSGEEVPVYIYCDDDEDVNTTADGEGNYVAQVLFVDVIEVNDEPSFVQVEPLTVDEDEYTDEPLEWFNIKDHVSDVETDIDDLLFSFDSRKEKNVFTSKVLKLTIDEDATVWLQTEQDQYGTIKVDLWARDGEDWRDGDANNMTLRMDVLPVNDVPWVTIERPSAGETVSGTVDLSGQAVDVEGKVRSVELRVDKGGWMNLPDPGLVWVHQWDSTTVSNGLHTITVRASDDTTVSSEVSIDLDVQNLAALNTPPTVQITEPANGAKVSGKVFINGTALDTEGIGTIVYVEVSLDGGTNWEVTGFDRDEMAFRWNYVWNTKKVDPGDYTFKFRAFDGELNSAEQSLTLKVASGGGTNTGGGTIDPKSGGTSGTTLAIVAVVVVAIVIAAVVAVMMVMKGNAKKRAEADEKRRKEREERRKAEAEAELLAPEPPLPMAGTGAGGLPMAPAPPAPPPGGVYMGAPAQPPVPGAPAPPPVPPMGGAMPPGGAPPPMMGPAPGGPPAMLPPGQGGMPMAAAQPPGAAPPPPMVGTMPSQ